MLTAERRCHKHTHTFTVVLADDDDDDALGKEDASSRLVLAGIIWR